MKITIAILLVVTPALVAAGPFPFPTKTIDAVAEVEVVLPRRGKAKITVLRWLRGPRPASVKLEACFTSRQALRQHKALMWSTYWATRKMQISGDRDRAMAKAKREWRVKGRALRRLLDEAARRGRYQGVVYYNREKPGHLRPLCGFTDVIYLKHWVKSPGHRRWLAGERRRWKRTK